MARKDKGLEITLSAEESDALRALLGPDAGAETRQGGRAAWLRWALLALGAALASTAAATALALGG